MKAIDSNLLVYASLANHPAMMDCEQYIASYPVWLTNIVNLVELWRVLISVSGLTEADVNTKFIAKIITMKREPPSFAK